MVLVGLGAPVCPLPVAAFTAKELDVRGIFRYANWCQESLSH